MTYYCTLFPDIARSGGFTVEFPDVEGVVTEGDDLEHSLAMAKEALELMLESKLDRKKEISLPMDRSQEGLFPIEVDKEIAKRVLKAKISEMQKDLQILEQSSLISKEPLMEEVLV